MMGETPGQPDGWARIEPHRLDRVSVVAQCLDNQWVPTSLLQRMLADSLSLQDVQAERSRRCHAEYMRSLVNARQVVVNRAYFYNNPVVFGRYVDDAKELKAIRSLLGDSVLVPFLLEESSPLDRPHHSVNQQIWEAWNQLCLSTPMTFARLSWDDKRNTELSQNQLWRRFLSFAATAVQLTEVPGCSERLARDLKLHPAAVPKLGEQLRDIARANLDGKLRTRDDLYRMFIVADGTRTSDGCYDRGKPFAQEIKQLFDLQYNVNLPDALVRLPLTPQDSLGRSALQEIEIREHRPVTAEDLLRLIRGRVFEVAQHDLAVPAFEDILPSDVVRIRQTSEWAEYAVSLDSLLSGHFDLSDPESIAGGIHEVSVTYGRLADQIGRMVRNSSRSRALRWRPAVKFVIRAAGAVLFVHFVVGAIVLQAIGEIATSTAAELVLEVVIGKTGSIRRTAPTTSYELFRGRMEDPPGQWAELVGSLRELAETAGAQGASVQPSSLAQAA